MLRTLIITLLLGVITLPLQAQPASDSTLSDATLSNAYRVYRTDGQTATFDDVVAAMGVVDVVFVGEQHDDPVAHYLQAALLEHAYQYYGQGPDARSVTLSLEMFESDVQLILDEYLVDLITEPQFLRSSRPWQNYKTDYRPLVEFAKVHDLRVLAANAPRRYVNRVSRLGTSSIDALSVWAKAWLPPLPLPGPSEAYEAKWNRLMAEMMAPEPEATEHEAVQDSTVLHTLPYDSTALHTMPHAPAAYDSTTMHMMPHDTTATYPMAHDSTATLHTAEMHQTHMAQRADTTATQGAEEETAASDAAHGSGSMIAAQAFWDASMAHAIAEHLKGTPNGLVLHMVGSFHVEEGLGTPAQLDGYRPGTKRLIVIIKAQDDFTSFDESDLGPLGDFVILTDKSLPRSYEASIGQ